VQYLSIRYNELVSDAGGVQIVGSRGDSYDNALAESLSVSTRYVVRLARRVVAVGVEYEVAPVSSPLIREWGPAVLGSSRVPA
jgi:hypothetical protein